MLLIFQYFLGPGSLGLCVEFVIVQICTNFIELLRIVSWITFAVVFAMLPANLRSRCAVSSSAIDTVQLGISFKEKASGNPATEEYKTAIFFVTIQSEDFTADDNSFPFLSIQKFVQFFFKRFVVESLLVGNLSRFNEYFYSY